ALCQSALVLTVRDRQEPLGSGGATLNALLVAAEHLSSRAGHTVSLWTHIHICHAPLLKFFIARRLQSVHTFGNLFPPSICPGSPPGVWVCSTDMILTVPPDFVLALPGEVSYAANHGVYLTDPQGRVRNIIYRGTQEQIQQALMSDGKVPLVSGPVFFCRSVSEKLLQTHVTPPLDGCTYLGLDSGAPPLQVSFFFHVQSHMQVHLCLHHQEFYIMFLLSSSVYVPGGCYDYLTLSGKEHVERLSHDRTSRNTLEGAQVINSIVEGDVAVATGAVVQHCHLQGPLDIPSGCLLSGLEASGSSFIRQLAVGNDIIIQGHRIELGELRLTVHTVMGAHDDLQVSCDDSSASFLNQKWSIFFCRTGIQPEELWIKGEQRSLLDARLFPVLHPRGGTLSVEGGAGWLLGGAGSLQRWRESWRISLREVLSLTCQEAELQWREELLFLAGRKRVTDALQSRSNVCLLPCFRAAVLRGHQGALLETLDNSESLWEKLGAAARCLSCIADVLVCMAGGKGGLRSGPAANELWSSAYALLEKGDLKGGVKALAVQRQLWLSRPDLLVRAARHYEGAGQVLLRQAVMSSQMFISIGRGEVPPLQQWQEVQCPARLDLAGGWSDTPPIAFEHGGSVTNIAVKVDGRRPIGAKARRIPEPHLRLVSYSGGQESRVSMETVCESLQDLKDYCQPHAPGALLKAVCVCSGLVSLSSQDPLEHQLMQRWGGGVELHSWSELPTGSGLGTSSILAGALLAAVYRCTGQTYDTDSLIHAVLYLEQILTTGGGWQDQVGGLVGGVKVGRSRAHLPLRVEVERLSLREQFLASLEQHLLLVYTGKTRLARNLLQDVVRSWYSRLPAMVQNAQQLVSNSEECARACSDGSLSRLGQCLDRSWQHKKLMAPGCEPASVRVLMDALRPLVLGQSLAGAGGGGFLYLLTKEPRQQEVVLQVLRSTPGLGDFSVHYVELDMDGITVVQPTDT
uniref:L-fucose kinase n=1 Tax=Oryzias sinensis TaxID=183150 RepID=A0A8C7Z3L0_9TELE